MTSDDFGRWLESSAPALEAWGAFVVEQVTERLRDNLEHDQFSTFLKVPPTCRRKAVKSALAKLAGKNYANPVEDMTDLVGARFVVLLKTDIQVVERALVDNSAWVPRKDRSFEHEQQDAPKAFDYQSVHYVLRNSAERQIAGVAIPEGMTCEVQIRTLLQHAYAELVHDRVYKEGGVIPPAVNRLVARCMALMETTDDMFCEAVHQLAAVNTARENWCHMLDELYQQILPEGNAAAGLANDTDALDVLDTFSFLLNHASVHDVRNEITPFLRNKIRARAKDQGMFASSVVPLVYWMVKHHYVETLNGWTNDRWRGDLEQVAADLGKG